MDVLAAPEIEAILQRLEAVITALEHDLSARTLYTFVLTAQASRRRSTACPRWRTSAGASRSPTACGRSGTSSSPPVAGPP